MLINIVLFIYNFVLFQNSDRYYYMRVRVRVSVQVIKDHMLAMHSSFTEHIGSLLGTYQPFLI